MTRFLIATFALFALIGPMAAGVVIAFGDFEHCNMKSMQTTETADVAASDDPDCCSEGCSMPTCCRLMGDLRLISQIVVGVPIETHSDNGFSALPDAPRAAHTWGIERPPKV